MKNTLEIYRVLSTKENNINPDKFEKVTEDLKKMSEELRDDITNELIVTIEELKHDLFDYEEDHYIAVYSDGEDYNLFVDDNEWQRRERVKMLRWKLIVSCWVSELYEEN